MAGFTLPVPGKRVSRRRWGSLRARWYLRPAESKRRWRRAPREVLLDAAAGSAAGVGTLRARSPCATSISVVHDIEVNPVHVSLAAKEKLSHQASRHRKSFNRSASLGKCFERIQGVDKPVVPNLPKDWSCLNPSTVDLLGVLCGAWQQPNAIRHTSRACSGQIRLARRPRRVSPGPELRRLRL